MRFIPSYKDPKQQTATTLHTYLNEYDDPNASQELRGSLESKNLQFNHTMKPEELDRRSDARTTNRRRHVGKIVTVRHSDSGSCSSLDSKKYPQREQLQTLTK